MECSSGWDKGYGKEVKYVVTSSKRSGPPRTNCQGVWGLLIAFFSAF